MNRGGKPDLLVEGTSLDDKYVIERLIRHGGMGAVYEGHHRFLARRVAIKVVHPLLRGQAGYEKQFLAEGRMVASLDSPHVVSVFDFGVHEGMPYMVMELLEGETLDARLANGRVSLELCDAVMPQVLSGLSAAHDRGIVHRDLKPANVFLLFGSRERPRVKLLDFGIGLKSGGTEPVPFGGTPAYSAPEQLQGLAAGAAADLYSAGATLYEMLAGRPPYIAESMEELIKKVLREEPPPASRFAPNLAPAIDAFLLRSLAKEPDARFSSAAAMLDAFRGLKLTAGVGGPSYVLIAEGEPRTAELFRAAASRLGLDVHLARDGVTAIALTKTLGAPAAVVCNLSLPRRDGFALLRDLRRAGATVHTPAIAVSAVATLRAAAWDLREELGVVEVLAPNISPHAAERALEDAFSGELEASLPRVIQPETETQRLQRIESMNLEKDMPEDEALDRLVRDVALAFGVPIALVSIVMRDKQWFKAHFGLRGDVAKARSSPRDWSFCQHVVESREPLVVPDARSNPAFAGNPMVKSGAVGGYAGAPVITSDGHVLGTLCIVDSQPLEIGPESVDALGALARRVAAELELSHELAPSSEGGTLPEFALSRLQDEHPTVVFGPDGRAIAANAAFAKLSAADPPAPARAETDLIGRSRTELMRAVASRFADRQRFLDRVAASSSGPYVALELLRAADAASSLVRWTAVPIRLAGGVGHVETFARAEGAESRSSASAPA